MTNPNPIPGSPHPPTPNSLPLPPLKTFQKTNQPSFFWNDEIMNFTEIYQKMWWCYKWYIKMVGLQLSQGVILFTFLSLKGWKGPNEMYRLTNWVHNASNELFLDWTISLTYLSSCSSNHFSNMSLNPNLFVYHTKSN